MGGGAKGDEGRVRGDIRYQGVKLILGVSEVSVSLSSRSSAVDSCADT